MALDFSRLEFSAPPMAELHASQYDNSGMPVIVAKAPRMAARNPSREIMTADRSWDAEQISQGMSQ